VSSLTHTKGARVPLIRALLVVALLLPVLVQPARADESGGAKNVVLAFNYQDGALRSASRVAVSIAAAPEVGSENLAYAQSSCSNCRTVAVAMQAVAIVRDANVIVPKNVALAVNVACQTCQTAAFAYQYVLTTGGMVRLSERGRLEVSTIRAEASELAASSLPFPEIEERFDQLGERFRAVIDAELTDVGAGGSLVKRVDVAG
jgi:hypothetical protein